MLRPFSLTLGLCKKNDLSGSLNLTGLIIDQGGNPISVPQISQSLFGYFTTVKVVEALPSSNPERVTVASTV